MHTPFCNFLARLQLAMVGGHYAKQVFPYQSTLLKINVNDEKQLDDLTKKLQNLSVNNLSTVRQKINEYSIKILTIASEDPKIEYYYELIKRLYDILDNLNMVMNESQKKK